MHVPRRSLRMVTLKAGGRGEREKKGYFLGAEAPPSGRKRGKEKKPPEKRR